MKNNYKSALAVFPLNWAYKNWYKEQKSELLRFDVGHSVKIYMFAILEL